MSNTMTYRGYSARIDFESSDGIFVGRLLGMNESIIFHGASVDELRGDFHFAVDHYLSECEKMGQKPEKPASGKLLLRLPADTHAALIIKAAGAGKSVNQFVSDMLAAAIAEAE